MNNKRVILIRNAKKYDFGGGERFPVFLGEILKKIGYHPLIFSRSSKLIEFARSNTIPVKRGWWWSWQSWSGQYALLFPIYLVWQAILFAWYLAMFIPLRPHVVHIQSKDDFIAGTFAARVVGATVIWTDHADLKHVWQNVSVWNKNPVGKLVYLAAFSVSAITVVSQSEERLVVGRLPKQSSLLQKIKVIYNGVSDMQSSYKMSGDSNVFTFCTASRLVTDKGIRELITAFNRFSKVHPLSKLILIGDGPEANAFKEIASANQKIEFTGYQTDPLKYVAISDVFVHPTYHEGFSVALVEASMLAKPIITTAVGGNVEIVHDHTTGLLVEPKDPDGLYAAMEKIYIDAELRSSLGEHARMQYEKRFNFNYIVQNKFVPLYEKGSIKS